MLTKTGLISKEQKEQILQATNIVDLISGYVRLKSAGKNFLGLCPFHNEKTPSFVVSPVHQNYKCYGCGEHGDAIRFVMEIENFHFVEALHFLADRCGISIQTDKKKPYQSLAQSEISKCLQVSLAYFRSNLKKALHESSIKKYLRKRLISEVLIEKFQLGYVQPGWTNLHKVLKKKSIPTLAQENAGLIKKGDKGGYYDRLRDRLVFPIRDQQERILGFAGRAIGDDKPKYLNSPETELYKKSSILYGAYEAKDQIRRKRRIIIVEGYLDVIRLHEQSWTETVATCGTALTESHVNATKRLGANDIILLFDGDKAGINAAKKSVELFLNSDMDSKVIVLPDGLDPDDYFKEHSTDDFQLLLENASHDYEFLLNQVEKETSGTGIEYQKAKIQEVLTFAQGIKDPIKRELFLAKISAKFGIKKQILKNGKKNSSRIAKLNNHSANNQKIQFSFTREEQTQVKLLQYLITHQESISRVRDLVKVEDFENQELASLYSRFIQLSNEEFQSLSTTELPAIFVEYNSLLMYLLHNESEYWGPGTTRAGAEEMLVLKIENEQLTQTYSRDALDHLIKRFNKQRKISENRQLYNFEDNRIKDILAQRIEKRRKKK